MKHENAPEKMQELPDVIMSIWTRIFKKHFQHLVESMPQRIEAVLTAKRSHAKYYNSVPNNMLSECNLNH